MARAATGTASVRGFGLSLAFVLLSGCYLSHGRDDAGLTTDSGSCVRASDCDDGDPCTEDTCEAGVCVVAPRPYDHVESFTVSGAATDVTRHGDRALVLTHPLGVEAFGVSGHVGERIELAGFSDRDWDSALVSTGSDVALSTVAGDRLVLRMLSNPSRIEQIDAGGLFVRLAAAGDLLVASTFDVDLGCAIHVADRTGRFVGPSTRPPGGCPSAYVAGLGLPPALEPVGVSPGEVRLLTTDAEGSVSALAIRSDGPHPRALRLPLVRGPHASSLVAAEGASVIGAQWVEMDDARTQTLVQAVVAEVAGTLTPVGAVRTRDGTDLYAFTMATSYCAGRFTLVDGDRDEMHLLQLLPDGTPLGEVLTFGGPREALRVISACIPGALVVIQWQAVHVLTCEP